MSLSGRSFVSPRISLRPLMFATPLLAMCCFSLDGQAQQTTAQRAPAASTQNGPVVLSGTVLDPDAAEIPGATLTLTPASGKAFSMTSAADGTYSFRGVPPGTYSLTVTMPGFAAYVRQGVRIAATAQTIDTRMAIQDQQTVVNVTTNQNTVSVDQDSNASATVLRGKDLDALSDDPDQLSSELSALAGPAAGPNGGQIYIDGFTGGQLPPKSSIREIRVNQNPFSAQYDRAGFGRVEIFTKPGTDAFHGSGQINGNDKSFNTGSPFSRGVSQPGYHTIFSFGQLSGPINKRASFTVGGSYRQIQTNSIVDPPAVYATSQTAGTFCYPGTPGCSIYSTVGGNGFTFAQFTPQTRWDIAPRVDLALTEKNTLTARFQSEHNSNQFQGIGGADLASVGSQGASAENEIQISDSQIISDKIINETRFEYNRETSHSSPYSTAPLVVVQGGFTGGGSSAGTSNDVQNHIELQNYTSIALARHFIRLGGRMRYTGETNTSTAGQNGIFSYNSIDEYVAGKLATFTITNITNPTVKASYVDLGLYAEDDWKIKPNWTFSYGLRYETQNFIHDQADFAPRFSTAYGLGKKTVLRAGTGIFYDRFGLGNQLNTVRNNGINEQQSTISATQPNGGIVPIAPTCGPATINGCPQQLSRLTEQTISGKLRAPYNLQANLGVDQQLFNNATLAVNYQHIHGVHQFNSDVPDYAVALNSPLLYQYQSEGVFNQNQLTFNINVRNFHGGSFGGFYLLNFAKSDTSGANSFASTPNNLKADYGRANFDTRNRVFLYGSFTMRHLITISPFLVASSGSPYNITAGFDRFGDNNFNTRALLVPDGTVGAPGQLVKSISGCGTFAEPPSTGTFVPAPVNYCTGPGSVTLNVRTTKTFGFGRSTRPAAAQGGQGGPGGPGGPGGRGGPGGGGGRGGFGGGGGASSGKRYNLAVGFQAQNIFNVVDRSVPVGTLTSPSFGTSTQLAGNIFTTDSAVRRIQLQASFNF